MVSEPASHLLAVEFARADNDYLFKMAADADAWACHYFFGMKLASLDY
jgi:hypothetical protein